jgi:hypothetical protein
VDFDRCGLPVTRVKLTRTTATSPRSYTVRESRPARINNNSRTGKGEIDSYQRHCFWRSTESHTELIQSVITWFDGQSDLRTFEIGLIERRTDDYASFQIWSQKLRLTFGRKWEIRGKSDTFEVVVFSRRVHSRFGWHPRTLMTNRNTDHGNHRNTTIHAVGPARLPLFVVSPPLCISDCRRWNRMK